MIETARTYRLDELTPKEQKLICEIFAQAEEHYRDRVLALAKRIEANERANAKAAPNLQRRLVHRERADIVRGVQSLILSELDILGRTLAP